MSNEFGASSRNWRQMEGGDESRLRSREEFALECSKASLEFNMDELETLNRLEPNIAVKDGESVALLSLAISAKRLADRFDRRTPGQRVEEAHASMVNALPLRNQVARSLSFSSLMKLVGDYFHKRTGIRSGES